MKKIQPKILLVLLLGLVLFGINYLSQQNKTPDPTANWKIYANTKYGYSIKYPPSYYVNGFTGQTPTKGVGNEDSINFRKYSKEQEIELSTVTHIPEFVAYDSFGVTTFTTNNCKFDRSLVESVGDSEMNIKNIIINGVIGERWDNSPGQFHRKFEVLAKKEFCYFFSFFPDPSDENRSNQLFEEVLSTFEFTD